MSAFPDSFFGGLVCDKKKMGDNLQISTMLLPILSERGDQY